jgi:hypothetical protein
MTRHCEHVKANGHFCGSPAMRGRNYCFFHIIDIGRRLRLQRYSDHGLQAPAIELPLLEDAASIQLALMQVTDALLKGTLDRKTAGLVLYSLQTASSNLRNMQKEAEADANANAAICDRYDSFEQDYELDLAETASLRVEDPAESEQENIAAAVSLEAQPGDAAFTLEDDSSAPATAPRRQRQLRIRDEDFQLPIQLTEEQYLQAKCAIFQYRMDHDIDAHDVRNKVAPQRAAISQNILMGARKPVQSVRDAERESVAEEIA